MFVSPESRWHAEDGVGRRELLRAGFLSLLDLSTPELAWLRALSAADSPAQRVRLPVSLRWA